MSRQNDDKEKIRQIAKINTHLVTHRQNVEEKGQGEWLKVVWDV
jgi:hypothetical protein